MKKTNHHYIRINNKYKMYLYVDPCNIIELETSKKDKSNKIATIKDKSIIYILYSFSNYKKAYLIYLNNERGEINLPETKMKGKILIEQKRQKAIDLFAYLIDIKKINNNLIQLDNFIKYDILNLILHINKSYNRQNIKKIMNYRSTPSPIKYREEK